MHLWSKSGDPSLNGWWVMVRTTSKWSKFGLRPWKSKSIVPQNNRDLNKLFCTFGPNFVIPAWTGPKLSCIQASDWHTHTQTHTDAGNDNTRRPKLTSGKIKTQQIVKHEHNFWDVVCILYLSHMEVLLWWFCDHIPCCNRSHLNWVRARKT